MVSTIAAQMGGFALMLAIGALCARLGMVDRSSLRPMIALSTKAFLPALLFATVCERMSAETLRVQLPMVALEASQCHRERARRGRSPCARR